MSIEKLKEFTVEKLNPIIGAKTVQLIIFREILDFAVFRTEEGRELNTVVTPRSIKEDDDVQRVAFIGTKQKAVESRTLERILRSAGEEALEQNLDEKLKYNIQKQAECYLKDNLCLQCPRCVLFGATSTESGKEKIANIKHRIEYSTAFSLLPFEEVETSITFNAINDVNQKTGQALGSRYAVRPATLFPSIITLKSATLEEVILTVKTILAAKSYGAETRIGGDVRNTLVGIVGGWEEIITSMELTLELYDYQEDLTAERVYQILKGYKKYTGNQDKVKIISPENVNQIISEVSQTSMSIKLLASLYDQVNGYRQMQKV
ncbi:type I-D CRISPR-associated protein Cas7/Csc2 [Desulfitibacter alkalitolerans]|uniref:type I-D CRISPR-associated protein Cas7/Csc2 n=1 Tax=Desulfitibacter alkalitolerans TaxID=264641 RepID=UPI0004862449|nr:type I-D CRISPR-associated protein Cas7/Csc2 [Desulfitibacter alkalitolerans]